MHYGATTALAGLDLHAPQGLVTAVLGPNGAGKTTAIECAEGLRRPQSGTVRVLGVDPWRANRHWRARVGVMLQESSGGYPGARATEMLRHVARLYADPLPVEPLIERLGLGSTARTPVRRLSGGLRQRLALAMAVVGRPELVFLDEPSAGLDPQARLSAWGLVEDLRRDGVSVVLTTHLMEEAERLADVVHIVDGGRVVASGSPEALTESGEHDVSFSGPPRLDLADLGLALAPAIEVSERTPGRYRVTGPVDAQVIATLTAWCAAHGVMPEGLHVGRRTLEDVFLDATGRDLRP